MEEQFGVAATATGIAGSIGPVSVAGVGLGDAVLDERDVGPPGVTDPAQVPERGDERGSIVALEPDLGAGAEARGTGDQVVE